MRFGCLLVAIAMLGVVAGGCATAPSFEEQQRGVLPPASGNGRLYVYRLQGDGGSVRPSIKIDGESVGRAVPGSYFYRDMPVGNYEISTSSDKEETLAIRLRSGELKYVRIDADLTPTSWDITPIQIDSQIALEELVFTRYSGN